MQIIIRRSILVERVSAWLERYKEDQEPPQFFLGRALDAQIRTRFAEIDLANASEAQLEEALGFAGLKTAGTNHCYECGQDVPRLVHFGDDPDYDAIWQRLCLGCLQEGVALIAAEPEAAS